MRSKLLLFVVMVCLAASAAEGDKPAKSEKKAEKSAPLRLKIGDTAPDFTLLVFDGKDLKKVSLSDYRGKKNVALAFFVLAFTGG